MNDHAKGLLKGILALITGSSITLRELLTNGSLVLTVAGAVLAVLGGWWTYRTARINHHKAELELQIRELELQRILDRHDREFPPP